MRPTKEGYDDDMTEKHSPSLPDHDLPMKIEKTNPEKHKQQEIAATSLQDVKVVDELNHDESVVDIFSGAKPIKQKPQKIAYTAGKHFLSRLSLFIYYFICMHTIHWILLN